MVGPSLQTPLSPSGRWVHREVKESSRSNRNCKIIQDKYTWQVNVPLLSFLGPEQTLLIDPREPSASSLHSPPRCLNQQVSITPELKAGSSSCWLDASFYRGRNRSPGEKSATKSGRKCFQASLLFPTPFLWYLLQCGWTKPGVVGHKPWDFAGSLLPFPAERQSQTW